jgi:sec-independent protein translocase protein TatC
VALSGIIRLFVGKPLHPVGDDGRMALSDHLRELRARILRIVLVLVVSLIVALFFFDPIYHVVFGPYETARDILGEENTLPTTSGAGGGLLLYLKLCGFTALVVTAPVWLWQIWAFIMPGLHPHERTWSRIFISIATPLFFIGIALAYITLPKGLEILIGFNPDGIINLLDQAEYIQFFTRTLLVFGIAFEIPVFVVLLNLAGIVKGRQLAAYRPWIVIGSFIFAAIATPSADPFTMTFMAVPMVLLFFVSELIARWNDRRKARNNPYANLSPDEVSPL